MVFSCSRIPFCGSVNLIRDRICVSVNAFSVFFSWIFVFFGYFMYFGGTLYVKIGPKFGCKKPLKTLRA